jgi:hypothetical protein
MSSFCVVSGFHQAVIMPEKALYKEEHNEKSSGSFIGNTYDRDSFRLRQQPSVRTKSQPQPKREPEPKRRRNPLGFRCRKRSSR